MTNQTPANHATAEVIREHGWTLHQLVRKLRILSRAAEQASGADPTNVDEMITNNELLEGFGENLSEIAAAVEALAMKITDSAYKVDKLAPAPPTVQ